MKNLFDLSGKVAIITGASSGLGADAARAFAQYGAKLAILARRYDRLEMLQEELQGVTEVIPLLCDVTDEEQVKNTVSKVEGYYGRIDILLNNAGMGGGGNVESMDELRWNKFFDTNVKSDFLLCKYVLPIMKKQHYGKIINIASINAILVDKDEKFVRHAYNASKAAVVGLTRGIAASHGKFNITCNAVGPGLFESEMTKNTLFKAEKWLESYNCQNPMGRPGERGELNGTLLYFASDASSYVNGQFVIVDGGLLYV